MFFAGSTVTIALVSLAVAGIPLVTTMGLMAAIAVVVAVLAALTLLPAELAILGPRINSLRVRTPATDEQARTGSCGRSWANEIAKQPMLAGLVALAILIPLTIPLLSLTLGQQDDGRAVDLDHRPPRLRPDLEELRPGRQRPAADRGRRSARRRRTATQRRSAACRRCRRTSRRAAGVAAVVADADRQGGNGRVLQRDFQGGPAEAETTDLVNNLRASVIPAAEKGTNMHADVGGSTAAYDDLATEISSKLPLQIAVVIALSFVLLITGVPHAGRAGRRRP